MGKMSELNAEGVTDLYSYTVGVNDTVERFTNLLEEQIAVHLDHGLVASADYLRRIIRDVQGWTNGN